MYDIVSDWCHEGRIPNTYCKAGVYSGMQGPGITRKDTIFGNQVAKHACIDMSDLWEEGTGSDHAPLAISIDAETSNYMIHTIEKPVKLDIICKPKNKDERSLAIPNGNELFIEIWNPHYSAKFQIAHDCKDVDAYHHIWCNSCKQFLLAV